MQNNINYPPTGEAGAPRSKKTISTSKGLIIVFAAAVILFGGAYTRATYTDPLDYDSGSFNLVSKSNRNSNANANINANTNANGNQNTSSEISDWLTYTNDTYGFSFKYPKEWKIINEDTSNVNMWSKNTQDEQARLTGAHGGPVSDFAVRVLASESYLSDMAWAGGSGSDILDFINNATEFKHQSDTMLDNITAVKADTSWYEAATYVVVVNGANVYEVTMSGLIADLTETQNKILTTFRFIN